jgi:hypothetical protein
VDTFELVRSELEPGDKLLVQITANSVYKLAGIPVDEDGKKYDHAPEIRLWAGHDTALRKSNFGEYAEVELIGAGFSRGQLRATIRNSSSFEDLQDRFHPDTIRKLAYMIGEYDSPLPELSDEELSIDKSSTTEAQDSESISSKHVESNGWKNRKGEMMNNLSDL